MFASAFDLYRIGLGPSSTHTVGPMRAAQRFVHELEADGLLFHTRAVRVDLFGSVACTGRELGTDRAVLTGLCGEAPETVEPAALPACAARVSAEHVLALAGRHRIAFDPAKDIHFRVDKAFDSHSNAIRITARNGDGNPLVTKMYFSVGDGQIVAEGEAPGARSALRAPFSFATAGELMALGQAKGKRIAELMRINELALRSPGEVQAGMLKVATVMRDSIERGLTANGVLPGGGMLRRAGANASALAGNHDPAAWAAVYATAVAEENAAGGRVVAAPSNGSAGPVAAVLHYWRTTTPMAGDDGTAVFLLAAAAIGQLARSSGLRHSGCQGEVGVAAAMAAAGMAAVNNASNSQLLFAAERALDSCKGLTCDPVGGLVQDPCIGRNASAAANAIRAAQLGLRQPEPAQVAFDPLVRSMVESGRQMASRYKEFSLGGIAVSVVDC